MFAWTELQYVVQNNYSFIKFSTSVMYVLRNNEAGDSKECFLGGLKVSPTKIPLTKNSLMKNYKMSNNEIS